MIAGTALAYCPHQHFIVARDSSPVTRPFIPGTTMASCPLQDLQVTSTTFLQTLDTHSYNHQPEWTQMLQEHLQHGCCERNRKLNSHSHTHTHTKTQHLLFYSFPFIIIINIVLIKSNSWPLILSPSVCKSLSQQGVQFNSFRLSSVQLTGDQPQLRQD